MDTVDDEHNQLLHGYDDGPFTPIASQRELAQDTESNTHKSINSSSTDGISEHGNIQLSQMTGRMGAGSVSNGIVSLPSLHHANHSPSDSESYPFRVNTSTIDSHPSTHRRTSQSESQIVNVFSTRSRGTTSQSFDDRQEEEEETDPFKPKGFSSPSNDGNIKLMQRRKKIRARSDSLGSDSHYIHNNNNNNNGDDRNKNHLQSFTKKIPIVVSRFKYGKVKNVGAITNDDEKQGQETMTGPEMNGNQNKNKNKIQNKNIKEKNNENENNNINENSNENENENEIDDEDNVFANNFKNPEIDRRNRMSASQPAIISAARRHGGSRGSMHGLSDISSNINSQNMNMNNRPGLKNRWSNSSKSSAGSPVLSTTPGGENFGSIDDFKSSSFSGASFNTFSYRSRKEQRQHEKLTRFSQIYNELSDVNERHLRKILCPIPAHSSRPPIRRLIPTTRNTAATVPTPTRTTSKVVQNSNRGNMINQTNHGSKQIAHRSTFPFSAKTNATTTNSKKMNKKQTNPNGPPRPLAAETVIVADCDTINTLQLEDGTRDSRRKETTANAKKTMRQKEKGKEKEKKEEGEEKYERESVSQTLGFASLKPTKTLPNVNDFVGGDIDDEEEKEKIRLKRTKAEKLLTIYEPFLNKNQRYLSTLPLKPRHNQLFRDRHNLNLRIKQFKLRQQEKQQKKQRKQLLKKLQQQQQGKTSDKDNDNENKDLEHNKQTASDKVDNVTQPLGSRLISQFTSLKSLSIAAATNYLSQTKIHPSTHNLKISPADDGDDDGDDLHSDSSFDGTEKHTYSHYNYNYGSPLRLKTNDRDERLRTPSNPLSPDGTGFLFQTTRKYWNEFERHQCGLPLLPTAPLRQFLDILFGVVLVYSIIAIPLEMAFEELSVTKSTTLLICNIATDSLYLVFVCFEFLSAFPREDGRIEMHYKEIAKNYLFSLKFWVDIIALFPAYLIEYWVQDASNESVISYIGRVWRLFFRPLKIFSRFFRFRINSSQTRVQLAWKFLNYSTSCHPAMKRLFMLMSFWFLFLHFGACIWYALGTSTHLRPGWIDSYSDTDGMVGIDSIHGTDDGLSLTEYDEIDTDFTDWVDQALPVKYTICLYFVLVATTSVGFGDISARNTSEMIVVLVFILVGYGLLTLTMSTLTSVWIDLDSHSVEQRSQMSNLLDYLDNNNVSQWRKNVIITKMHNELFSHAAKSTLNDMEQLKDKYHQLLQVLRAMPVELQLQLASEIFSKLFSESTLFIQVLIDSYQIDCGLNDPKLMARYDLEKKYSRLKKFRKKSKLQCSNLHHKHYMHDPKHYTNYYKHHARTLSDTLNEVNSSNNNSQRPSVSPYTRKDYNYDGKRMKNQYYYQSQFGSHSNLQSQSNSNLGNLGNLGFDASASNFNLLQQDSSGYGLKARSAPFNQREASLSSMNNTHNNLSTVGYRHSCPNCGKDDNINCNQQDSLVGIRTDSDDDDDDENDGEGEDEDDIRFQWVFLHTVYEAEYKIKANNDNLTTLVYLKLKNNLPNEKINEITLDLLHYFHPLRLADNVTFLTSKEPISCLLYIVEGCIEATQDNGMSALYDQHTWIGLETFWRYKRAKHRLAKQNIDRLSMANEFFLEKTLTTKEETTVYIVLFEDFDFLMSMGDFWYAFYILYWQKQQQCSKKLSLAIQNSWMDR